VTRYRVPLVVLETDVVRRLVLADERRLEMKRVPLGIDRDEVEIPDLPDQGHLPGPMSSGLWKWFRTRWVQPLRFPT